jgi:hypothetical protein
MVAIGSLVSDQPVPTTPSYCTADDVAEVLNIMPPGATSSEGEPTLAQWNNKILRMEEYVDRITRTNFRIRKVLLEYHDWTTWINQEGYYLMQLERAPVRTLDTAAGDILEVWNGGGWEDWLTSGRVEGRNRDYWIEEPSGYLRIRRNAVPITEEARVRISYRSGESAVPADIVHACALMTAAELVMGDRTAVGGPSPGGQTDRFSNKEKRAEWLREAYVILANYQRPGKGY